MGLVSFVQMSQTSPISLVILFELILAVSLPTNWWLGNMTGLCPPSTSMRAVSQRIVLMITEPVTVDRGPVRESSPFSSTAQSPTGLRLSITISARSVSFFPKNEPAEPHRSGSAKRSR